MVLGFKGSDRRAFAGQQVAPAQRAAEKFGQITGLIEALDGREHQFDCPLGGHALGLQRVGQAEPADHQIGAQLAAAVELQVHVLAFGQPGL